MAEVVTQQKAYKELENNLLLAHAETTEVSRRLQASKQELYGASEDLVLMTRENQVLTGELAESAGERDFLKGRLGDVVQVSFPW